MSKIIVLQGPPASGKSTWAREYIKTHSNDTIIVSRDNIRESCGEYWVPSREDYITEVETMSVKSALEMGFNVIIDATNLNPKTINKWNEIASVYGCEIEFKEFYIPFEEAVDRDAKRGEAGGHMVGKKVLKNFYYKYYAERFEAERTKTVDHYRIEMDHTLPPAVICDLDGTIAWMQGRSPYDTKTVDTDKPDKQLILLLSHLFDSGVTVLFTSGREGTDECRFKTLAWLNQHLISAYSHKISGDWPRFELLMRKKGDYRPDEIVKREIYENNIKGKYNVLCAFDDRNKVVDMWREIGLLCCQVANGNF